jgi:hypothetical protein
MSSTDLDLVRVIRVALRDALGAPLDSKKNKKIKLLLTCSFSIAQLVGGVDV